MVRVELISSNLKFKRRLKEILCQDSILSSHKTINTSKKIIVKSDIIIIDYCDEKTHVSSQQLLSYIRNLSLEKKHILLLINKNQFSNKQIENFQQIERSSIIEQLPEDETTMKLLQIYFSSKKEIIELQNKNRILTSRVIEKDLLGGHEMVFSFFRALLTDVDSQNEKTFSKHFIFLFPLYNSVRTQLLESCFSNRPLLIQGGDNGEREIISSFFFYLSSLLESDQPNTSVKLKKRKLLLEKEGGIKEFILSIKTRRINDFYRSLDFKRLPTGAINTIFTDLLPLRQKEKRKIKETIILKRIDKLNWEDQTTLLKFIEKSKSVFQVICTSSTSLEKKVSKGDFRQDLFSKLNANSIELPNLVMKRNELLKIAESYLNLSTDNIKWPDIKSTILSTSWSFESFHLFLIQKERESLFSKSVLSSTPNNTEISQSNDAFIKSQVSNQMQLFNNRCFIGENSPSLNHVEQEYIINILKKNKGNYSKSARILGISRKTLYNKVNKFVTLKKVN